MMTDKEYPATHSMDTTWYCVDEEGNVGLFAIEENGPAPEDWEEGLEVNDVFWHDFSTESRDGVRDLNLSSEQIESMLMPVTAQDVWEKVCFEGKSWAHNESWNEVIIKIDMAKLPILLQAASIDEDKYEVVCLSRETGYFFVRFAFNKEGVDLLEKNQIVLARYKAPQYGELEYRDDSEQQADMNNHFPAFVYQETFHPKEGPAKRMSNPTKPVTVAQLPIAVREQITKLPLKFKETEYIQIAEYVPVYVDSISVEAPNERWSEIRSSNNETVYYGETSGRILTKEEIEEDIKQWIKDHEDR